jgi:hypothetical protein
MSRKYEIVNVGGVNRVRALRSWVVQGRQVNAGDVGGAVFDERTLSQDGACWIFSGRLNNPLVRVGGDSVVDIVDVNLSGSPFVNIFGTSSLDANGGLSFAVGLLGASPLTPDKMEQGGWSGSAGQPLTKVAAPDQIRSTERTFTGGGARTVPAPAPGYSIRVIAADADGIVAYNSGNVSTEVTVPAGAHAYAYISVMKSPLSAIVPADVTAAAITFQGYAEATLNIVDSHITVTSPNTGYVHIGASGDYQSYVTNIEGSTLQVNRTGGTPRLSLVCDLINTSATVNMGADDVSVLGVYKNVKNLVWEAFSWVKPLKSRTIIQATDCDNFVMDGANIPAGTVKATNTPLVFIRCNMNKASIVNQPLINNTYIDVNFDLATADLGKLTVNGYTMVSSNVNGMYRLHDTSEGFIGALVESHENIKSLNIPGGGSTYNTTIYADAYLNGIITFTGANVIGNAVKKPKTRTIDVARVAVQGSFNTSAPGSEITGVISSSTTVCVPVPFPIKGSKGLTVNNVPSDISGIMFFTNANNVIASTQAISAGSTTNVTGQGLTRCKAFLRFVKTSGAAITPEDIAGVTVTTYNGCKIVNTKESVLNIAGNVRVEDNATLIDTSVTGTGYFGGNSVIEAPTALTAPMPIEGAAYMKDNAVFSPLVSAADAGVSLLDMRDKAVFSGTLNTSKTFYNITMANNAEFKGSSSTRSGFVMRGNSFVASSCTLLAACRGLLVMNGDARVESGNLTAVGHITLTGNYRQTATKVWTGKRVIDSQDAPQYDNNVKTQYDF